MKRKPFLTSLAALATTAILAGCTAVGVASTSGTATSATTATVLSASATVAEARAANQAIDAQDTDVNTSGATTIKLTGSSAEISGDFATVEGNTVTITAGGTYVLSGTLNGQIVVNSKSDEAVNIVLKDATITSSTGSAISFVEAGEAVIVLADGTTNTLTDAKEYADTTSENATNAALWSSADLTIGGSGTLNVTGNYNDGITSKDGLAITSGTINVTAKDDGIRGKDYVAVTDGEITVKAGGDAVKADNDEDADRGFVDISGGTLKLSAGTESGDGIDAVNDIIVSDGKVTITQSYEGIEALNIVIGGGDIDVTAKDDGINVSETKADEETTTTTTQRGPGGGGGGESVVNGTASITGGTLTIHSDGDGFDSNGTASITGGTVIVDQTGGGNGALDVNGEFTISGGTLIALGDASMPVAPSTESSQGWLMAAVSGSAGDKIQILSGSKVIAEFTATRSFGNIVYSGEGVTSGTEYTVSVDGTTSTVTAGQATAGQMGGGGGGKRP